MPDMSDKFEAVWDIEPHTQAKHKILIGYLNAFSAILARQAAKVGKPDDAIRFVDGFAGPGIYRGGEKGSPIQALDAILAHTVELPIPIRCTFIEKDPARFGVLQQQLAPYRGRVDSSRLVELDPPLNADCTEALTRMLDETKASGRQFGPALVFLDQFGYSEVPIALIQRIMENARCEVLTYLNYNNFNRFLSDESKDEARTRAFGCDDWKAAIQLDPAARETTLLETYKRSLSTYGESQFVWHFAMASDRDSTIYWLFHCTNHWRGLQEVKRAMRKVDESGTFRFSDRFDNGQLKLLGQFDDRWLALDLTNRFHKQVVSVGRIRDYVLTDTPCHVWGRAMQQLKTQGKVRPQGAGKRISYTRDFDELVEFV